MPLAAHPRRFNHGFLGCLVWCGHKRHPAAKLVAGLFEGSPIIFERGVGDVIRSAAFLDNQIYSLQGRARRFATHHAEILERATATDLDWLNASRGWITDLLDGIVCADRLKIDLAVQQLTEIDFEWPQVIEIVRGRLRRAVEAPVPRKCLQVRQRLLLVALIEGEQRLIKRERRPLRAATQAA